MCNFSETQKQQKTENWYCGILLIGYFWKMHKNATKCNKTQSKWCINKHGASKIIDTFETYLAPCSIRTIYMMFSTDPEICMIYTYLVDINGVCILQVWCFLAYIPWVCKKYVYICNLGSYILGMCISKYMYLGYAYLGYVWVGYTYLGYIYLWVCIIVSKTYVFEAWCLGTLVSHISFLKMFWVYTYGSAAEHSGCPKNVYEPGRFYGLWSASILAQNHKVAGLLWFSGFFGLLLEML
jgi:hypothetical protein